MNERTFQDDPQTLNIGRSAVRSLHAANARVDRSAIQRLVAETAELENSAVGFVNAATVEVEESAAGIVAGDYVKIEDSKVFVLLAPRVSGNLKTVITLPVAFAIGAGFFVAGRLAGAVLSRGNR